MRKSIRRRHGELWRKRGRRMRIHALWLLGLVAGGSVDIAQQHFYREEVDSFSTAMSIGQHVHDAARICRQTGPGTTRALNDRHERASLRTKALGP